MFENIKFGTYLDYEYAYIYKLCMKRFKISNYKTFRLGEYLSLCMTDKFNKIGVYM
jgi:hypothetical protein